MSSRFNFNVAFFLAFHIVSCLVFFIPFKVEYLAVFFVTYYLRMFFVTAVYHRYFSHRSFKTTRVFQFIIAFLAMTSSQKGVLWWASHHRIHHRESDKDNDIHSPRHGWFWSHAGWFLSNRFDETKSAQIQDFWKYPELRWLDRYWTVPVWTFALLLALLGGWPYLLWGFFLSTVALWHGTFTINSMAHIWGTQPFQTKDNSRNNFILSLLTLGEGWHNNHHRYPQAIRSGIRWWEIDMTYYGLKVLRWLGLVSNFSPYYDYRDNHYVQVLSNRLTLDVGKTTVSPSVGSEHVQ